MADLRETHSDLLSVLLKGSLAQKKAILETLDDSQVGFISDLVFNFLNTFPLSRKERQRLYRKPGLLVIANPKKTVRHRKTLIKKYKKHIVDLLTKYEEDLTTLL